MTSSFVQASNTAWAGASKVRSIRSVVVSLTGRRRLVLVVQPPPLVRLGLRVALRRVLPLLLAAERRDVEVAPGRAHVLVAAVVDEVGPEDVVAVAQERVRAVPLIDVVVLVEIVGERVPGDVPAHPLLPASDVGLRRARDECECGVAGVQVRGVGDLVGEERAAGAPALGPAGHAWLEEEAVHDELAPAFEQVDQARGPVRSLEAVLLVDRHHRHAATLGGHGVTRARELLLLHEQLFAGGVPFLRRHDRWGVHRGPSSFRYSSTTSNRRPHRARWRSIQSAASLITSWSSDSRCVRPSTTRVTTPVSSSTLRCLEMAGFETPNPLVASPTVAGPEASLSTMPRRIGWARALNGSLTIGLTVANQPTREAAAPARDREAAGPDGWRARPGDRPRPQQRHEPDEASSTK